jgi:site-specific DNA-methyltransferase (adenine-specific)
LGAEREVIGIKKHSTNFNNAINNRTGYLQDEANRNNKKCFGYGEESLTIPATDEAKQWNGWGTALKPANEPICVARKPLSEKTIADNVLKWGTGGINIDDCRIPTNDKLGGGALTGSFSASEGWDRPWRHDEDVIKEKVQETKLKVAKAESLGRFPANVILDEEAGRMLDEQQKGASRFFYCAKASKKERNMGLEDVEPTTVDDGRNKPIDNPFLRGKTPRQNTHPTVKPVKLMEYLITLVTPPNGIVLDPFIGSGTTGIAALNLGFNYIGFELDKTYYNIATKRINA